jgi:wyosine [tRNA(Phe)-imidazoG37] synthetase (radical SAM superfamily)
MMPEESRKTMMSPSKNLNITVTYDNNPHKEGLETAKKTEMIAFGPIPSRRLGRSLGINNIPPKICPYSCIYCQLGRTPKMQITREVFYHPEQIFKMVEKKVTETRGREEPIDYLTFVPDGEPTLELNLGKEIEFLKQLGIKIAVITNSSLLWREDVREVLCQADWVSVKIDAISQDVWRRIDRPYGTLRLEKILQGVSDFSHTFKGELTTETMLVHGVNDTPEELKNIADFVARLNPDKSYLSIPTRPPAEKWVNPASEQAINLAYQVFSEKFVAAEYLIGYEGNAFAFTGNVEEDLLSITSVHPMREDALKEFLTKANASWDIVENLIGQDKLIELEYGSHKFYMRLIGGRKRKSATYS